MDMNEWEQRVAEQARALEEMVARRDWEALCPAAVEFSALLEGGPVDDAATRPCLEHAQKLVAHILPAVIEARATLESDIRQIARGRKAVSAYR